MNSCKISRIGIMFASAFPGLLVFLLEAIDLHQTTPLVPILSGVISWRLISLFLFTLYGTADREDTIKVPHDLVLKVEKAISTSDMGYRNRSEFIIEAVREKVQQLSKIKEVQA